MTTDNTAHPAPAPAPVAVPEGGWRAHEIVGTQKVRQGVAQTVPEDVVLCVTCGWLRCSEYLTHLLALSRPEPVSAPLPSEAVEAALEASRETPTQVASTSPETWMRNILTAALPHLRRVAEDDEDTVRVPRVLLDILHRENSQFRPKTTEEDGLEKAITNVLIASGVTW